MKTLLSEYIASPMYLLIKPASQELAEELNALAEHVGHEYYFPLNAHLLLPSLGQLYSTTETRRV